MLKFIKVCSVELLFPPLTILNLEINRSVDYRKEGKDGSKFIGSKNRWEGAIHYCHHYHKLTKHTLGGAQKKPVLVNTFFGVVGVCLWGVGRG